MMKQLIHVTSIIRIIAGWSLILGLLNVASGLLLNRSDELYVNRLGNQMLLWFFLVISICFGIGFFLSAYGLWVYKSWGRTLFLWLIVAWAALNIASLAGSAEQRTISELVVNVFRFAVTAL